MKTRFKHVHVCFIITLNIIFLLKYVVTFLDQVTFLFVQYVDIHYIIEIFDVLALVPRCKDNPIYQLYNGTHYWTLKYIHFLPKVSHYRTEFLGKIDHAHRHKPTKNGIDYSCLGHVYKIRHEMDRKYISQHESLYKVMHL